MRSNKLLFGPALEHVSMVDRILCGGSDPGLSGYDVPSP